MSAFRPIAFALGAFAAAAAAFGGAGLGDKRTPLFIIGLVLIGIGLASVRLSNDDGCVASWDSRGAYEDC